MTKDDRKPEVINQQIADMRSRLDNVSNKVLGTRQTARRHQREAA